MHIMEVSFVVRACHGHGIVVLERVPGITPRHLVIPRAHLRVHVPRAHIAPKLAEFVPRRLPEPSRRFESTTPPSYQGISLHLGTTVANVKGKKSGDHVGYKLRAGKRRKSHFPRVGTITLLTLSSTVP